jgi:hypothetical protein
VRLTKAQVSEIYELCVDRALENVDLEPAVLGRGHMELVVASGFAYGEEDSESFGEWLIDGDGQVLSARGGGAEKQAEREDEES